MLLADVRRPKTLSPVQTCNLLPATSCMSGRGFSWKQKVKRRTWCTSDVVTWHVDWVVAAHKALSVTARPTLTQPTAVRNRLVLRVVRRPPFTDRLQNNNTQSQQGCSFQEKKPYEIFPIKIFTGRFRQTFSNYRHIFSCCRTTDIGSISEVQMTLKILFVRDGYFTFDLAFLLLLMRLPWLTAFVLVKCCTCLLAVCTLSTIS